VAHALKTRHHKKAPSKALKGTHRFQALLAFVAAATLMFLGLLVALKMSLKKAVKQAQEEEATPLQPRNRNSDAHFAHFADHGSGAGTGAGTGTDAGTGRHGAGGEEDWVIPDMPDHEESKAAAAEEGGDPGLVGTSARDFAMDRPPSEKKAGGIGYDFV
jgi:hypothetical protein